MNRRHLPAVPKTTAVVPGATVNIVLKADQPTGRTVSGVVGDVLTRGNHPRGIKVRLADGRVGRVQSMASTAGGSQNAGSVDGRGDASGGGDEGAAFHDAETYGSRVGQPSSGSRRGGPGGGGGSREYDEGLPSQQIGLDAYVKEAKPKRKGKRTQPSAEQSAAAEEDQGDPSPPTETLSCPVCDEFKGDEAAISHHVATHFD